MSTDLAKQREAGLSVAGSQMPDWMIPAAGEKSEGKEGLHQYFVPPTLKLVQSQSAAELRQRFKVGTVVALPVGDVVAIAEDNANGTPFIVVPILQMTEFVAFNPYKPGVLPTVRLDAAGNPMRTTDPSDPLAVRCRDFKRNKETCPEAPDQQIKYREVNSFLVCVEGIPTLHGMPCILRFSGSGFKDGKLFSTFIDMRPGHIYSNRLQCQVRPRKEQGNDFLAITVSNPTDGLLFVQEQNDYLLYQKLHRELSAKYKKGEIQQSYDDTIIDSTGRVVEITGDGLEPHDGENQFS